MLRHYEYLRCVCVAGDRNHIASLEVEPLPSKRDAGQQATNDHLGSVISIGQNQILAAEPDRELEREGDS